MRSHLNRRLHVDRLPCSKIASQRDKRDQNIHVFERCSMKHAADRLPNDHMLKSHNDVTRPIRDGKLRLSPRLQQQDLE
jgi:hypothetical protein